MELAFDTTTPLGFSVRCTRRYWDFISTVKHPSVARLESATARCLANPDQIRRSRRDSEVLLFDLAFEHRWLCVVIRRSGDSSFVITAYLTDAIKAGEIVWRRSN